MAAEPAALVAVQAYSVTVTVLGKLLVPRVRSKNFGPQGNLLSGNCDGGHGGNSEGEDVELHFDGLVFGLEKVVGLI